MSFDAIVDDTPQTAHKGHSRITLAHLEPMARVSTIYKLLRTSDSLNEGLPIKMTREKVSKNMIFFYEKDSRFNPRLIHKSGFLIGQVPIEKYGLKSPFLLFDI